MLGLRIAAAGKIGFALQCIAAAVILLVAGYASKVVGLTNALGDGAALGSGPSVGAMNILVMGLESRTNFQGQILDVHQLNVTHSGNRQAVASGQEGSQDTDTLILIHIFANGQKAAGFSIPRDDVVNYPHATFDGLTEGKIDAAYAYAYNESLGQTSTTHMSSQQRYLEANQAGELFEVQTVESVTGVHIDHFIESNIIGFYQLAQQFGGLEVCIQPARAQGGLPAGANLTDYDPLTGSDNSGFDAYTDGYNRKKGGKQYLHLSAAQSLAYVRSRDTIPGVDIGRTARQQAAISYLLWKFKTGGVLNDLGQITTLLSNAQSYLMYDSGWNLINFAQDMDALRGNNLHFTTLPELSLNQIPIPGYPSAQSANFIDIPAIQREVNEAFYGTSMIPSTASQVTVNVYNGSGTGGLATSVSNDIAAMGYKVGTPGNSSGQSQTVQGQTQVFYGAGSAAQANAQTIANVMGVQDATSLSSLPAGQVEVLIGSQVTAQPPGLEMLAADSVTASDYITGAENQAGESQSEIPANILAAANAGLSTDGPAYSYSKSQSKGTTSASPSASSTSSGSASSKTTGKKATSTAKKPAASASASSGTSSTATNSPYGISGCAY